MSLIDLQQSVSVAEGRDRRLLPSLTLHRAVTLDVVRIGRCGYEAASLGYRKIRFRMRLLKCGGGSSSDGEMTVHTVESDELFGRK